MLIDLNLEQIECLIILICFDLDNPERIKKVLKIIDAINNLQKNDNSKNGDENENYFTINSII